MPARVFIFIPAYNISTFLTDAIDSVLAQTFTDWELLVLDDYSTDDTALVVERYVKSDQRITYQRNEQNLGMLRNWNKGISYCKSELFAKLDGDDKWHPQMLERALDILDSYKDVGMVFTNYVNLNSKGEEIEGSNIVLPEFARNKAFSCLPLVQQGALKMLSYSVLRQGLSLVRSRIFNEVGMYRFLLTEETQASTDTEFYFRVGCHHFIYCIDEVLYYYRLHENSISALNHVDGVSELKIFEVKTVINDYYFKEDKISRSLWRSNRIDTNFRYLLFEQYYSRLQGRYLRLVYLLLKLVVLYPGRTIDHVRVMFSNN